jgi:hypothetical protein
MPTPNPNGSGARHHHGGFFDWLSAIIAWLNSWLGQFQG